AEWGGDDKRGAAGSQHARQIGGRGDRLEERVRDRHEWAVDQTSEREADKRDGDRREREGDEAGAPARDDPKGDPVVCPAAERPYGDGRTQCPHAEARPVGAEESRVRVEVVGDVDRKGILDRAVEKEEEPGEDDQPEQVVTAEETEAGLRALRLARLVGRR